MAGLKMMGDAYEDEVQVVVDSKIA